MDLTTYTSTELHTFCRGHADAMAGIPYDEHEDPIWQDGHRHGVVTAARKAEREAAARCGFLNQPQHLS